MAAITAEPMLTQYYSTSGSKVVLSGRGFLHSIVVNGGTAGTISIYDGSSPLGVVIATLASTNALAQYMFLRKIVTGIYMVLGANTQVTVIYGP